VLELEPVARAEMFEIGLPATVCRLGADRVEIPDC
jgi:hypothetical protein